MGLKLSTETIIALVVSILLILVLIKITISLTRLLTPSLDSDTKANFDRLIEEIRTLEGEKTLIYYIAGGKSLVSFNDKGFPEIERPPSIECSEKACLCICRGIEKDSCSKPFICEPFDEFTIIKAPNGEQVKVKGRGIFDLYLNFVREDVLVMDVKEK